MRVIDLFTFPKGSPPKAFPVPPFAWEGYGFGMCLVEHSETTLIVTNEVHLLFLDPLKKRKRVLVAPLGHQQGFMCVSAVIGLRGHSPPERLYCCVACSDGTFAILHPDGSLRDRFMPQPPAPRLLASDTKQMAITSEGDLFVYTSAGEVWRLSIPEGRSQPYASSALGLTRGADGRIWIAAEETRTNAPSICFVSPPKPETVRLVSQHCYVELVGVDEWGRLYWRVVDYIPKQKGGQDRRTDLLCCLAGGTQRFRVRLQGTGAVLPALRRGDAQIDAVVVSRRGEVYVFGYDYWKGTRVHLYKLVQ